MMVEGKGGREEDKGEGEFSGLVKSIMVSRRSVGLLSTRRILTSVLTRTGHSVLHTAVGLSERTLAPVITVCHTPAFRLQLVCQNGPWLQ